MQTQDAYNNWARTYDTVINKTRDLEAKVIRISLEHETPDHLLEIGCGTGKNTQWLVNKCKVLTAVDFSQEMLKIAREKITGDRVLFKQADITKQWTFEKADLIICSLVLEHIEDLSFIFQQAATILNPGGKFYIAELHPYKQLQGSRAKFEQDGNLLQLEFFIHHISEYFHAAKSNEFVCGSLKEWFDTEDHNQIPRLVSFIFHKK